jgi:transcriptional regulator with XRE-family HTH domain
MEARQLLAWNVRKIRTERGISQERLALDAGLDRAYFGRVERYKDNVSLATVDALANALGVPIADLFKMPDPGEDQPKPLKAGRKKL